MAFPGSYQSKFFKFVSRQSRQLSDRCAVPIRQAKVKTVWGLQILLYPLYRIVKNTRSQPLKQAVAKGWERLKEFTGPESNHRPAADTVIQRVRSAVKCFLLPEPVLSLSAQPSLLPRVEITPERIANIQIQPLRHLSLWARLRQSLGQIWQRRQEQHTFSSREIAIRQELVLPIPLKIQGVATLLDNRQLVLVSDQSQILDVLTPQQQSQLQRWIIWELTEYYRQLRQVHRLAGRAIALPLWSTPQPPLPAAADHSQQPPVLATSQNQLSVRAGDKPLWQQIRSRVNELWQGTQLPVLLSAVTDFPPEPLSSSGLDRDLIQESTRPQSLAPVSANNSQPPALAASQSQIPGTGWGNTVWQQLRSRVNDLWQGTQLPVLLSNPDSPPPEPTNSFSQDALSAAPNALVAFTRSMQLVHPQRVTVPVLTHLEDRSERSLEPMVERSMIGRSFTDELEAEVLSVGYEKHFLEQLLQWLDQLMVWVEGIADYLWQKLVSIEVIRRWQQRIKRYFS